MFDPEGKRRSALNDVNQTGRVHAEATAIVARFLEIYRYLNQYSRRVEKDFGISGRKLAALRYLAEAGDATIGGLGDYLHVNASSASELVSKLEDRGLVQRARSIEDSRIVWVSLTSKGREIVARAPLAGVGLMRERLKTLSDAERMSIAEALEKLADLLGVEAVNL